MAFDGMMIPLLAGGDVDPNFRFDTDPMLTEEWVIYAGPGNSVSTFLTILGSIGGPPRLLGGSVISEWPVNIGTWHEAGAVTEEMKDGVQFRLTHVTGEDNWLSGQMNLDQWYDAQPGVPGVWTWSWNFRKYSEVNGTFSGEYLLEMRDSATLVVLDSATVQVSFTVIGAP